MGDTIPFSPAGQDEEELTLDAEQAPTIPTAPKPAIPTAPTPANAQRVTDIRQSLLATQDEDPERAAKVRELATRLGLPPVVVAHDYENAAKRYAQQLVPTIRIARDAPALASVLANPETAPVVKDDLEEMEFLEWLVKRPVAAFLSKMATMEAAKIRAKELWGQTLTSEEQAKHDAWTMVAEQGDASADNTWVRKILAGFPDFMANQGEVVYSGAPQIAFGGLAGTAIGATLGAFSENPAAIVAGAAAGARIGTKLGTFGGAAKFTFDTEGALALDEYRLMHDEQGRTMSPETARRAAIAVGALNAGFEVLGLEILLKSIPGVKDWTKIGARAAVKEVLKQPGPRQALVSAVGVYLKTLGGEVATEVAQEATTMLGGEAAKDVARDTGAANIPEMTTKDALTRLLDTGISASYAFALGIAFGPAMQLRTDLQTATRSKETKDFFTTLGQGVAQSKTVMRDPTLAMAFLKEAAKDGPITHVYATWSTWAEYWRQRGVDPEQVTTEVTGDAQAATAARNTGALEIPIERYAIKLAGTEHNSFWENELRLRANEMNARESEDFLKTELPRRMEEILAAAEQTSGAVPPTVTGQVGVAVATSAATPAASLAQTRKASLQTLTEALGEESVQRLLAEGGFELTESGDLKQYVVSDQIRSMGGEQTVRSSFRAFLRWLASDDALRQSNLAPNEPGWDDLVSAARLVVGIAPTTLEQRQRGGQPSPSRFETMSEADLIAEIQQLQERAFPNRSATVVDRAAYEEWGQAIKTQDRRFPRKVAPLAADVLYDEETGQPAYTALEQLDIRAADALEGLDAQAFWAPHRTQDLIDAFEDIQRMYRTSPGGDLHRAVYELGQEIDRRLYQPTDADQIREAEARGTTILHQRTGTSDALRYQLRDGQSRWYYSPLTVAVTRWKQTKGSATQIVAQLRSVKGAAAEAEEMGLSEWLEAHPVVTKAELQAYVIAHAVTLEETVRRDLSETNYEELVATLDALGYEVQGEEYDDDPYLVSHVEEAYTGYTESEMDSLPPDVQRAFTALLAISRSTPKYHGYVLPGGTNYREVLVRVPTGASFYPFQVKKDGVVVWRGYDEAEANRTAHDLFGVAGPTDDPSATYRSPHWDEPNVIFHLRMTDRQLADGRRVLFVEEVQSDLHQEGRKKGYRNEPKRFTLDERVPLLPFRGEGWKRLAMRRLLALAAEGGYDAIAWTTGQQQADRYSLEKQVSSIAYNPNSKTLYATDLDGDRVIEERVDPESIGTYIGEELAATLRAKIADHATRSTRGVWTAQQVETAAGMTWNLIDPDGHAVRHHPGATTAMSFATEATAYAYADDMISMGRLETLPTLTGLDLRVGGKGMKGFYDHILVSLANTLGKPYGVRTEMGDVVRQFRIAHHDAGGGWRLLADGEILWTFDTEQEAKAAQERLEMGGPFAGYRVNSTVGGGWAVYDANQNLMAGPFTAEDRATEELLTLQAQVKGHRSAAHVLATPPAMRADLLANGLPLYQQTAAPAQEGAPTTSTETLDFTVEDLMRALGLTRTQAQYTYAVADAMGLDLSHLSLARGGRSGDRALFSVKEWYADDKAWAREFAERAQELGWDAETAREATNLIDGVIQVFEAHKKIFPQEAEKGVNAFRDNQDFIYTFDVNRTCMRVKKYWSTVRAIEAELAFPLNEFQLIRLGQMMREDGDLPGCNYCYVEAERRANQRNAVKWLQAKASDDDLTPAMARNVEERDALLKQLRWSKKKFAAFVTAADFDVSDYLDKKRDDSPKAQLVRLYNRYVKSGKGSLLTEHAAYHHGILERASEVPMLNARAGLRWQSSTDLDPTQLAERLKGYADSSVVGLRGHEYAKEPYATLIFGDTNVKQNLSVAFSWNGTAFVSDDVNGMPFDLALSLRRSYKHAGTMLMAKNLEQLLWGLEHADIDMIIPHHAANWAAQGYMAFDLDDFGAVGTRVHEEWIDEALAPKWQAGEAGLPQQSRIGTTKKASEVYTRELWITYWLDLHQGNEQAAVAAYLAFCAAHNLHAKWSGGTYIDRHTKASKAFPDLTQHPGYLKLRKDYARTDSPQEAVDISRVNVKMMHRFMDGFIEQKGFAKRGRVRRATTRRFVDLVRSKAPLDIAEAEQLLVRLGNKQGLDSVIAATVDRDQLDEWLLEERPGQQLPLTVLDQLGLNVPQASVEFLKDARALIRGFAAADASSGIHELAHISRRWLFSRDVAPERRRGITDEDIATAEAECGVVDGVWTEEAEERFARMFERYVRDGEAPSEKLADLFAKFAAWLTEIYAAVTGTAIDVPVSAEMKAVFDHLMTRSERLAELTQQADQAAAATQETVQPLLLTPEAAGLTPEAFALYSQQVQDASRQQREALRQRALEQVARESRAEWRKRKAEMTDEVTQELADMPIYRAVFAIRQGTTPLGESLLDEKPPEPMRLDRAAIVAEFGEARLARLPRGLVTTEHGLPPEMVSGQFGFPSVDAMLTALESTTPFAKAVRAEVTRRMTAEHGSLFDAKALADRAQELVANDSHESVLRAELRALQKAKRAGKPFLQYGEDQLTEEQREREYERQWLEAEATLRIAIAEGRKQVEIDALRDRLARTRGLVGQYESRLPRAADLREMARVRLAAKTVASLNPRSFWLASRAASAEAAKAFLKGDLEAAEQAKHRELTAVALYREALKARDEIEAGLRTAEGLSSPAGQARLGLAGPTYQDAVNTVLDQYDLAFISGPKLARRLNLREWMDTQAVNDLPADLPDFLVTQALRVSYKELTLDQFRDVIDGLKNIAHLAKLKNKLLTLTHARDMDSLVDTLRLSAFAAKGQHALPVEFRRAEKRKRSWAGIFAEHSRIATLAYELDGHQEGGAWWQTFIRPLNDASVWERQRKQVEGKRLWKIVTDHYSLREIGRLSKEVFIPALGTSLSNEGRLAVALNWGRAANRDRMLADFEVRRWGMAQVQAILDTLDERDWQFCQAVWDFNGTFRDEMAAKQRRVTGIEPTWTEPTPVETRYGTFPGGYYHIAYDPMISAKASQQAEQTSAHLNTAAAYISSTTKRGHLKELAKHVERPLKLTLDVEFQHLDDVIHDLAYHETLIDLNRVFRRVGQTLLEAAGNDTLYTEFKSGLQDVASGLERPKNFIGRVFATTRTGTQLALLGANFWTAAQQVTGMFNGAADVGGVWVMRGLLKWVGSPKSLVGVPRWIATVSPFMADRVKNATMEIGEVRERLAEPGGWFDLAVRQMTGGRVTALSMADAMLWHIAQMQKCADIPVWLGSYEKAMASAPVDLTQAQKESRAVALADQSVRDSQGTADIHDLARVERGNVYQRLFTVFYHYGNTVFNTTRKVAGRTDFRSPKDLALLMGDLTLLYVMPAAATVALAQLLGKRPESEDWWDFFCEVGLESLATAFNTMVGLRELGSAAVMALDPSRTGGVRGYEGPAGVRFLAASYKLTYKAGQGDFDADFWRTANQVAGIYLHYPALQVERTVRGATALMDGQTQNPAALLVGPPPKR